MGHGHFMNKLLQEIMRKHGHVGPNRWDFWMFIRTNYCNTCFATSPHALSEKVFVFVFGMGLKLLAEKIEFQMPDSMPAFT